MYIKISASPDGIMVIRYETKEELLEDLNEDPDAAFFSSPDDLAIDSDPNYWGEKQLLIKGEVVQPKPKTVVKEFEID